MLNYLIVFVCVLIVCKGLSIAKSSIGLVNFENFKKERQEKLNKLLEMKPTKGFLAFASLLFLAWGLALVVVGGYIISQLVYFS